MPDARGLERGRQPLVELPFELILNIAAPLIPATYVSLSQTCCRLRDVLGHYLAPRSIYFRDLDSVQQLLFFEILSRDPDWWGCLRCMRVHRVDLRVVNRSTTSPLCPRPPWCPSWRGFSDHYWSLFRLDRQIVQLTLKYARLTASGDARYRQRLQRLLTPITRTIEPSSSSVYPNPFWIRYRTRHSVSRGLYLLYTVRRYDQAYDDKPLTYRDVERIKICPHQMSRPLWHAPVDSVRHVLWMHDPCYSFLKAVIHSFKHGGLVMNGACSYCTTDFGVRCLSQRLVVRCWQSLGPEGLEESMGTWDSLVNTEATSDGPTMPHVPGQIRALFPADEGLKDLVGEW